MRLQFWVERKRGYFLSQLFLRKSVVSDTVTAVSETTVIPDGIMSNI